MAPNNYQSRHNIHNKDNLQIVNEAIRDKFWGTLTPNISSPFACFLILNLYLRKNKKTHMAYSHIKSNKYKYIFYQKRYS